MKQRLRRAWAADDQARALERLRALASELDRSYPAPPARCANDSRRR
ncbi:MAG TPA: hypothetical protein VFA05_06350 [Gaiellaceae bacterium]|nr:hypothetical protein [Gaiellaceae bacterium]